MLGCAPGHRGATGPTAEHWDRRAGPGQGWRSHRGSDAEGALDAGRSGADARRSGRRRTAARCGRHRPSSRTTRVARRGARYARIHGEAPGRCRMTSRCLPQECRRRRRHQLASEVLGALAREAIDPLQTADRSRREPSLRKPWYAPPRDQLHWRPALWPWQAWRRSSLRNAGLVLCCVRGVSSRKRCER
jgi:hypothetical protein